MKSALFALILAVMSAKAFSQESQHCYKPDSYITVCEFSPSGRVNITSAYSDGTFDSVWYTRSEFRRFKASDDGKAILHLKTPTDTTNEAAAQSWHVQSYCEADGFIWRDGGCHARKK